MGTQDCIRRYTKTMLKGTWRCRFREMEIAFGKLSSKLETPAPFRLYTIRPSRICTLRLA